MLALKGITCINMVTRRPNPDDLASAESIMQKDSNVLGLLKKTRHINLREAKKLNRMSN